MQYLLWVFINRLKVSLAKRAQREDKEETIMCSLSLATTSHPRDNASYTVNSQWVSAETG